MKRHSAWLALGLLLFVVVACSFSAGTNRNSTNSNRNDDSGSGAIRDAFMARDDNGQPGAQAETFDDQDRTIHCRITLKDPKDGTRLRFAWWVVDAGGLRNEKLKEIDYTTKGAENIVHANLTRRDKWPEGKYKVEVFVDNNLEETVEFSVR